MFSKSDLKALRYSDYNGKAEVECIQWGCYKKQKKKRNPVRTSWMGHVTVGKLEPASIGYCLKYISKPKRIPEYEGDTRQKEFSQCSLGIGLNYLTPAMIRWHRADLENRMYINIGDGKKAAMPRYYKKKIYTDEDKIKITVHIEKQIQRDIELLIALDKVPTARDVQESYKYQVKRLHKNSVRERVIF